MTLLQLLHNLTSDKRAHESQSEGVLPGYSTRDPLLDRCSMSRSGIAPFSSSGESKRSGAAGR